jgi:hypothetical protein
MTAAPAMRSSMKPATPQGPDQVNVLWLLSTVCPLCKAWIGICGAPYFIFAPNRFSPQISRANITASYRTPGPRGSWEDVKRRLWPHPRAYLFGYQKHHITCPRTAACTFIWSAGPPPWALAEERREIAGRFNGDSIEPRSLSRC